MKKFDWNEPLTRKDYAVLAGWSLGFYFISVAITYTCWNDIKSWTGEKIKKIRKRFHK